MAAEARGRTLRWNQAVGCPSLLVLLTCVILPLPATAGEPAGDAGDARAMMRWGTEVFVLTELLEYAPAGDGAPLEYDLVGWVGGAVNRAWFKADGALSTRSWDGHTELQVLYGRLFSPFWDAQLGLRLDVGYGDAPTRSRVLAAMGVQGLAPGWFELEPTLFVSLQGDVSAILIADYDALLTQRLVLQPRLETGVAIQDVPEFGVGTGITNVNLGLRLRYEIVREFGPYVGISWRQLLMQTAKMARAAGRSSGDLSFVVGLRLWY